MKNNDQKLKQSRMHQGEAKIRWWEANPEQGTPYENILDPIYWKAVDFQIEAGDFIQVIPDERTYIAHLWVVEKGVGGIQVVETMKKDIEIKDFAGVSLHEHYQIKFAGPHHKWRVERKRDGHILKAHFATEAEANKWLGANAGQLAAEAHKDMAA